AQDAVLEILLAAERIDQLALADGPRHCVDREVAALEIVVHGRRRVDDDLEVVPARAGAPLAPGRRELDPVSDQLAQLAGLRPQADADELAGDLEILDAAVRLERTPEPVVVDAEDEEVRIPRLRLQAEKLVANRAADEVCVEPERPDVVLDL